MCFQSTDMLIKYANGSVQEGVLVSLRGGQMRVATKNGDDLLEFNLVQGIWISEHCEPVTFDLTLGVLESIGFTRDHQPAALPPAPTCRFVN